MHVTLSAHNSNRIKSKRVALIMIYKESRLPNISLTHYLEFTFIYFMSVTLVVSHPMSRPVFFWPSRHNFGDIKLKLCIRSQRPNP